MEWTNEQKRIIDLRNKNILVSAAAGSGKTAVLVERIISLIKKDNENIDKFLIVTFTNAAASGMKQKIQKSLFSSLKMGEGNREHLRKQINLLNKSNISTIHSFCIDVMRKNFHIIGIEPNFRIGDANEVEILLCEAIDEVLESAYSVKTEGFIKLVEGFTKSRGDSELVDIIKETYKFIQSFPEPLSWMKKSVDMLGMSETELINSAWMKELKENIKMMMSGAKESIQAAAVLCGDEDGPHPYLEAVNEDLYNIDYLCSRMSDDFESFVHSVYALNHPKLKALKGEEKGNCSLDKQSEVKALRDEYKKIMESIKKLIPDKRMSEFAAELNYMHEPMSSLYEIIEELSIKFKEKKAEKAIVDFNDVEHYAYEILKNDKIGEMYKKKFSYIFIDEYQDSNRLQEALIGQIKRKNNLFMVGDVKQSIYRFRLADPGLFNEKYNSYCSDSEELQYDDGATDIRVDLNKNFRSVKEILNGTNYIFKNIMSEKLGEVKYSEKEYLNCGTDFEDENNNFIEIDIIDKNADEDSEIDDEIKSMKAAEIEAKFALKKIYELLKLKIYVPDKKECRNIEYKDIVILMRSVSNWAQIFEEAFNDENIPFYFDGGGGYFETIEIQIILNLLKIVDNIRQDIPLMSIMRSPIGRFTTEELIAIRVLNPKLSYIDAVYAYKNKGNDELAAKLMLFIEKIESWKKKCRYSHLNDFIWEILMETGYYYFVGALPNGNMRQANLRLLTDKALEYEKTSMRGLFNFLRFIEKINVSSGDMSTAKTLGENDNVVRLMSVHKSKGLEFPVVLMCGANKKFNRADITKNILRHNDLGIAPKYINVNQRIYKETFPRIALKNVIKIENLSEEMRVLYVAMTRAVNKLIIVGSVSKIESKIKKWKKGPTQYNIFMGDSFMDWICMSLYSHKAFKNIREQVGEENCNFAFDELDTKWEIKRIPLSEISCEETENKSDKDLRLSQVKEFKNHTNSLCADEINNRLGFSYVHRKSVNVPTKLSVTDIKLLNDKKIENVKYKIPALRDIPLFNSAEGEYTKAEIGTIVHFVMQHLDLRNVKTVDNINDQIKGMVDKKLLTEKEASTVNSDMLNVFFNTEIGGRMINSPIVRREIPFVIKKQANEIIDSLDGSDIILVQGIIDCYFYEGDEVVIIDYKTDDVTKSGIEIIKEKYRPQIMSYREAVEKITGKKVKGCYLYLFEAAKAIEIN